MKIGLPASPAAPMPPPAFITVELLSSELASKVVENTLPWASSSQLHIEAFLRQYTLHDSHWLGLNVECGYSDSAVACIILDTVWNPLVFTSALQNTNSPMLFLRFSSVSNIRLSGFWNIGHVQRGISEVTVQAVSEEETLTTLHDHHGAVVSVQHFSLIDFLIMSPTGELITPVKTA